MLSQIQFRVSHLLWITFWLALLLTAMKLTGLLIPPVISFLAVWLVLQTVSLAVIWQIERRVRQKANREGQGLSS